MNNNDKKKCLRQEFECRQVNFVKRDIEKKIGNCERQEKTRDTQYKFDFAMKSKV